MRRALARALLLVFALPCFMLLICGCSGWESIDFAEHEYFALTDADGKEYVYVSGEAVFDEAARAFSNAAVGERPDWFSRARSALLAEWIQDGHARQYRLYLLPEEFAAYVEDSEGNGAHLAVGSVAALLATEPCRASLRGEDPPSVSINGVRVEPSICSWSYAARIGTETVTIRSDDYFNQSAATYPLDSVAFEIACTEQPTDLRITVYRVDEELATLAQEEISSYLSSLPSGQYQLIAVLEWTKESLTLRAGYSFTLNIP